jgi:hypothetical protein
MNGGGEKFSIEIINIVYHPNLKKKKPIWDS